MIFTKEYHILLAVADPNEARLIMEAFKQPRLRKKFMHVPEGVETVLCLRREGSHAQSPRPHLVVLDWDLPAKPGAEVLAMLKSDEHLRRIPVVVLTPSEHGQEVERAYDLAANCCVPKLRDPADFRNVMSVIESFWLTVVKLPLE
jgi:two-component system response regulator